MNVNALEIIKNSIKTVPNYPKEGIMFRDVTSLMQDPAAFRLTIEQLVHHYQDQGFTKIVGAEARGFIFGAVLAKELNAGFIPVRKPGKLPRETYSESYTLEYGVDTLEIHQDAIQAEDKVLMVDDLLATGGTIEATTKLIRKLGATVEHVAFVVSLPDLGGEERLSSLGLNILKLVEFEGE
ncbi:adenine phosphoribosyltransferase [Algicola sagamiensis]|uniref:adenine phosphoribosyltransferase n=1 Tax=Algicola sagamiensis TaxID=163869 RepID=UPI0003792792